MQILNNKDRFKIEITKEIVGLDFMKVGNIFNAHATFIGRQNKLCVVTDPVWVCDINKGSHWIHSDNFKRV